MQRRPPLALDASKLLLLALVFSGFSTKYRGVVAGLGSAKGCDELACEFGEQCVSRTFWCPKLPCPSMNYCSKSRKESLKGPESCRSVRCPSSYKCVVNVRDCKWNQKCKDRVARCISEAEYFETPTSCADVVCPTGYLCVLRETHCIRSPCKLTKSCARKPDVDAWYEKCKRLGCHSEHDCFLRRPADKCSEPPCTHVPDCLSTIDLGAEEQCRGWICPPNLQCRAESSCHECPLARSCHEPLARRINSSQPIDIISKRTTLADLEREVFLEERRKLMNSLKPTSASSLAKLMGQDGNFEDFVTTRASQSYKNPDQLSAGEKSKRVTAMPSTRAAWTGYSPWLTYLKRTAGAEALQYWMEKAKNNEDYEEFKDWLETVEGLLEPETHRLWFRELELLPELRSWLSRRHLDRSASPDAAVYEDERSDDTGGGDAREALPGSIDRLLLLQQQQRPTSNFEEQHLSDAQGFSDIVKNSWKSWQSYYQGNPLPAGLPGFPLVPTPNVGPYYFRNYTGPRIPGGFDVESMAAASPARPQQQQPQIFFPRGQNGFGKAIANSNSNQWPSAADFSPNQWPSAVGAVAAAVPTVKPVQLDDNFYGARRAIGPTGGSMAHPLPVALGSAIDQIPGFQQLIQSNANFMSLDASQHVSQLFSSNSDEEESRPNLLIYFPPPLNFFIYLLANNHTESANISVKSDFSVNSAKKEDTAENSSKNATRAESRSGHGDKHKEFEYIRKVIHELLAYWDKREKSSENSESAKVEESSEKNTRQGVPAENGESVKEDKEDVNFSAFLEWLSKNTTLLDEKLEKAKPAPSSNGRDGDIPSKGRSNSSDAISAEAISPKIRILVDVDKNPEIIKALLSKNRADLKNHSDTHEYQVILNSDDLIDRNDEELITRKLMDIASTRFNRNITSESKMPKILWVFPVYEDEENLTLIDHMNASNSKVTTLEDIEALNEKNGKSQVATTAAADLKLNQETDSQINEYYDDSTVDDYDDGTNDDYEEREVYDDSEN